MDSVAVLVVWLYVEGVARDQPPDLCRDVVSTVAQTFSYEIIGRQVLDRVVRTFDVVRYVSVVGKVHDEARPRAKDTNVGCSRTHRPRLPLMLFGTAVPRPGCGRTKARATLLSLHAAFASTLGRISSTMSSGGKS